MEKHYQDNSELYKWMEESVRVCKVKTGKANKHKLVSGEEDHSDSSGNEVCLNEHKMNFLLLHKHPSVSKGAVDGSSVTVCNFLIRSTLCISVANSWVWGVPNWTADLLVWGLFVLTLGKQTSNDPRQELGLWFPADRIWSDSFAREKDHTLMLMVPSPSYKFTGLTGNGSAAFCDSSLTGEVIGSPGGVGKDTVDKNWYRTNAEDRRVCAVKWCVKYLRAGVWRASLAGWGEHSATMNGWRQLSLGNLTKRPLCSPLLWFSIITLLSLPRKYPHIWRGPCVSVWVEVLVSFSPHPCHTESVFCWIHTGSHKLWQGTEGPLRRDLSCSCFRHALYSARHFKINLYIS